MASRATDDTDDGVSGQQPRPDAAKAFEIYDKQIKPKLVKIDTARGECSQPWQDIKEHAHFPRPVMNFIIALENIDDEAKRDHYLLALSEGLRHRELFLPRDLVTMADGAAGGSIVGSESRARPKLATLDGEFPMGVPSDGTETDLADAGEDTAPVGEAGAAAGATDIPTQLHDLDDFTEATDEELSQQEGRPKSQFEKMYEATHGKPPEVAGEDEQLPEAAE